MRLGFWLRWSWRDLKARWLQVAAIGIIIALGAGIFSGFGGQKEWRTASYDLSYGRLNMFDLRMEMADGSFVDRDELLDALAPVDGVALETRLLSPTLVDASNDGETILVQGELVGMTVDDDVTYMSSVNGVHVDVEGEDGRYLTEADSGQNRAILEFKFASVYDIRPGDTVQISGGHTLDVVGLGQAPEYFLIIPPGGGFLAESSYAVIFAPLATVQALTDREGLVNDLLVRVDEGVDRDAVEAQIRGIMGDSFPDVGVTFTPREEDPGLELSYNDAEGDQQTWTTLGTIFLLGAAIGAFNLAGRMVESQRRQIGIGMALGVPRLWIALRPMLVGVQIAVIGTTFGVLFGFVLKDVFGRLVQDFAPLPFWEISVHVPSIITGIALGIIIPFIATLIPTWRAVRVAPIDAIKTGHLVAKGGGLSWLVKYLPLPAHTFAQMPFKNVLRSPWRTGLTIIGVSIAILLLALFLALYDTFVATADQGKDAALYQAPDRVSVTLDFFYPEDNDRVTGIETLTGADGEPLFSRFETGLLVGGQFIPADEDVDPFDTAVQLIDMDNAIWVPDLLDGALPQADGDTPGIVLSEKAANDLGVDVGDTVTAELPLRQGLLSFRLQEFTFTVTGIHNSPLRPLAYVDLSAADTFGMDGLTNIITVTPASADVTDDDIKRALFNQPGVISAQPANELATLFDEVIELFALFLGVVNVVVVIMAFLIAFNSTSINVDERSREIATMFAFGLPIRTVARMQVVENLITGFIGTVLGILLGWLILVALVNTIFAEQLANLGMIAAMSPQTLLLSLVLGVAVVGLTPLLSMRRMRKMDLPSTLRVME